MGTKPERRVILKKQAKDGILSYCKMKHPYEAILILKGKSKKGIITVDGLTIPPFSYSDQTFAGFPQSFLPFDLSYVGTAHSHPSGSAEPSVTDLHHFFGLVSIIVQSPYDDNEDIFAWDSQGNPIEIIFESDDE
ncbi:MAG: Mov34/MPN/PAD-1 family protein [Candidatus Nitrosotenuis sp.]